ncbi:MAG: hypothetical protein VYA84_17585 [Planctomycetota bacterium]|nr:hypothetical protein [Planctomycetota bacterium]
MLFPPDYYLPMARSGCSSDLEGLYRLDVGVSATWSSPATAGIAIDAAV